MSAGGQQPYSADRADGAWLFWSRFVGLAAVYAALGVFVLSPEWATSAVGRVIWPSSGVALAAVMRWGAGLCPAVAIGAGVATYISGGGWPFVLGTALGNGLEICACAALLQRLDFDSRFRRARSVLQFVGVVSAGAAVSALFGVLGMAAADEAPAEILPRIGWLWAASHAMGSIVVAPFLLTLGQALKIVRSGRRGIEFAAVLAGLATMALAAFRIDSGASLAYLPFPLLVWASVRFGPPGAAPANLILSGLALWWTARGWGPFAQADDGPSTYLFTWGYATATAATALFLAASIAQGRSAEKRRRRQADDYRFLLEQAADGVLIFAEDGACLEANSQACEMLGLPADQLLGSRPRDLVAPSQVDLVEQQVRSLHPGGADRFSWRMRSPGGKNFPAEVSAKRFPDGRVQAFLRDVTARQSLEAQLTQAQKLEAAGRLAGGVAHEFNNLLTLVIGHALSVRSELEQGSKADDHLSKVVSAAERAGKLTRRLLTFARQQPAEPRVLELNELVSDMAGVLPRMMGEDVQFVTVPSNEPWLVRVDPGLLQQVILNVALNARDAMPDGGRLVMECRNIHLTESRAGKAAAIEAGDYAVLAVTDTGKGMSAEVSERVFEPFFTTKSLNKGAGLGMAVSHGIIRQAGGDIRLISEPGKGTTVEIYLPRVRGTSDEIPRLERKRLERSKGETILLIEDEQGLRDLVVDALSAHGYEVLTAADGEEGIRICGDLERRIDLIISDVVLPGVAGPEAVREIRRKRPGLSALFVSGYSEERMTRQELERVGTGFLAKPFRPDELASTVRAMLDDPARGSQRAAS